MTTWNHNDPLQFGVGIEDTFIADEASGRRKLDEYELTQHNVFWQADLDKAAESGAQFLRWGIPWYRVNPEPGRWDFSWVDRVVERLHERGLRLVVDLMHYGTPLWLEGSFANTDYPKLVADYAHRVAERYHGAVSDFTPLNEPLLNVIYCGEFGAWPPLLTGDAGFATVLRGAARGIVETQAAIRAAQGAEASFVHVEASYRFAGAVEQNADTVEFLRQRAFIVEDLVTGGVGPEHPLADYLARNGFSDDDLAWHQQTTAVPDVMGVNYYPAVSTELFVEGPNPRGDLHDPRPRVDAGTEGLKEVLSAFAERYGRPVMLSETSAPGTPAERIRWLDESVTAVDELRAAGVPVVGYTWWAVFGWINWDYREGTAPVEQYLNTNGLWNLELDAAGVFQRVPTPVIDAYRAHARRNETR